MITLESLVKEHFPLLEDGFNYKLGKPKYTQIHVGSNRNGQLLNIGFAINTCNGETYQRIAFTDHDGYKKALETGMSIMFSDYVTHSKFQLLIDNVYENTHNLVTRILQEYESKLIKVTSFEMAYLRREDDHACNGPICTKLFYGDGKLTGAYVYRYSEKIYKRVKLFKGTSNKNFKKSIDISGENLSMILEMYEKKFILNDAQRKEIKKRIQKYIDLV